MKDKYNVVAFIIIVILFFLSSIFAIYHFGVINNILNIKNSDIYILDCDKNCNACDNPKKDTVKLSIESGKEYGLIVRDDYSMITNKEIKVFSSSSSLVSHNRIAPSSTGEYKFYIKNNNSFDVVYNINFAVSNPYSINLKYRLKENGKYLIKEWSSYSDVAHSNVFLKSKNSNKYTLEYKWVESDIDTEIGNFGNAGYKLYLSIFAREVIK